MSEFHGSCESLEQRLQEAERDKTRWMPVGDVILDNLHEQLTVCKVHVWWLAADICRVSVAAIIMCTYISEFLLIF